MNTKNYLKFNLVVLTAFAVLLGACKKDRVESVYEKEVLTKGIYVLNEGTMGSNNSSISYYDIDKKTVVADFYKQVNGSNLGETANDLKIYGSKLYCVISGIQGEAKSFIDVMDAATAKTIKRISFNNGTEGRLPKDITFYKNKAYVSSYDGTISRIDTTSLNIDGELQLKNGAANAGGLEGAAIANGKLYVNNSVHPSYPTSLKDKVTVIDLATFTKTKDITVTLNPVRIAAAANGDLLVVSWGNFGDIAASLQKISSVTDAVTGTYTPNANAFAIGQNVAYLSTGWGTEVISFNVGAGTAGSSFVKGPVALGSVNGITVNPLDQSVVVADAVSYGNSTSKTYVLDKDGNLKYSFDTGTTPKTAAFAYRTRFITNN